MLGGTIRRIVGRGGTTGQGEWWDAIVRVQEENELHLYNNAIEWCGLAIAVVLRGWESEWESDPFAYIVKGKVRW